MGFVDLLSARIQKSTIPTLDEAQRRATRFLPRLPFFRRRIRLKTISVPLSVVIFFPLLVIILILILFLRHPKDGTILMPAGSPPSIRSILHHKLLWGISGC